MNAAASVLGSVLAMVIAIQFGLNVTLACGVAAYLLALLLLPTLPRRAQSSQEFAIMLRWGGGYHQLFPAPPDRRQRRFEEIICPVRSS